MGRPAIAKKKKGPSIHSRAARRATSPGIDLDKSLKTLRPPTDRPTKPSASSHDPAHDPAADNSRPAVLGIHRSAGVHTTRRKAAAAMSSRARKRRERGADMAVAVAARTEQKVEGSWDRARSVAARRKAWEVINGRIGREMDEAERLVGDVARGKFGVLGVEGEGEEESEEEDGDGGDEDGDGDGDEDLVGGVEVVRAERIVSDVRVSYEVQHGDQGGQDEEIL